MPSTATTSLSFWSTTNRFLIQHTFECHPAQVFRMISGQSRQLFNCQIEELKSKIKELIIVSAISMKENVTSIKPVESQSEAGIQFVDNICSVIRLHKTGKDSSQFYVLIHNRVKEVRLLNLSVISSYLEGVTSWRLDSWVYG